MSERRWPVTLTDGDVSLRPLRQSDARRWREVLWRVLLDSAQLMPGAGPEDVPGPHESFLLLPHQSLLLERMLFP